MRSQHEAARGALGDIRRRRVGVGGCGAAAVRRAGLRRMHCVGFLRLVRLSAAVHGRQRERAECRDVRRVGLLGGLCVSGSAAQPAVALVRDSPPCRATAGCSESSSCQACTQKSTCAWCDHVGACQDQSPGASHCEGPVTHTLCPASVESAMQIALIVGILGAILCCVCCAIMVVLVAVVNTEAGVEGRSTSPKHKQRNMVVELTVPGAWAKAEDVEVGVKPQPGADAAGHGFSTAHVQHTLFESSRRGHPFPPR